MKITLLTPALAAILGLALASAPMTSQAQDTTTTVPTTTASTKPTRFGGTITAINATSVTVANKEKTRTLAITPNTKFKIGKDTATLADFAVDDKVGGSYSTDASGAMTAILLHKRTASPPAPAATTAAPATTPAPASN